LCPNRGKNPPTAEIIASAMIKVFPPPEGRHQARGKGDAEFREDAPVTMCNMRGNACRTEQELSIKEGVGAISRTDRREGDTGESNVRGAMLSRRNLIGEGSQETGSIKREGTLREKDAALRWLHQKTARQRKQEKKGRTSDWGGSYCVLTSIRRGKTINKQRDGI